MTIISACLVGIPCRYNGENKTNINICNLINSVKTIVVCPEQLGGLPTPRPPAEISNGRVVNKEGIDFTESFKNGADIVLALAKKFGCDKAILKARSPSCGKGEIYDGTFSGKIINGNGITADLLIRNGILVITEDEV